MTKKLDLIEAIKDILVDYKVGDVVVGIDHVIAGDEKGEFSSGAIFFSSIEKEFDRLQSYGQLMGFMLRRGQVTPSTEISDIMSVPEDVRNDLIRRADLGEDVMDEVRAAIDEAKRKNLN